MHAQMKAIVRRITTHAYQYRWYLLIMVSTVIAIGRPLLPSDQMFLFHDRTQYARIIEFAHALSRGEIPPIYASQFNFGIGYPVFLFYAPLAYWITAMLYVSGLGVVTALKSSMLLALIIGAWGTFAWISRRFMVSAGFVAAIAFVTSPWIASEIFVRGNLATLWFLALAPWSLWALGTFEKKRAVASLLIATTILTHNALSLLWIPVLCAYSVLAFHKHRLKRLRFVLLSSLVSGAFWIPALLQLPQMHATRIAQLTDVHDHFLCVEQIWTTASWGFGGSARGCIEDGMSFMLGKLHIVLALIGITGTLILMQKHRKTVVEGLFFIWALFFTLYDSAPLWDIAKPLQVVQFPWRFLSIALIFAVGLAGAGAFALFAFARVCITHVYKYRKPATTWVPRIFKTAILQTRIPKAIITFVRVNPYAILRWCIAGIIVTALLFSAQKFFWGPSVRVQDIETQLASLDYRSTKAAYDIPEYVPKTVDYATWQTYRTTPPNAQELARLTRQFDSFQPNGNYQIIAIIIALTSFVIILWVP